MSDRGSGAAGGSDAGDRGCRESEDCERGMVPGWLSMTWAWRQRREPARDVSIETCQAQGGQTEAAGCCTWR
eukprot:12098239-Alexandrium_andersonii.AAC.1